MDQNPYQASKWPAEVHEPLTASHHGWLMAGLVMGIVAGPIVWLLLLASMHEYHDPPLSEQIAEAWPGMIPFTAICAMFGACFGLVISGFKDFIQGSNTL